MVCLYTAHVRRPYDSDLSPSLLSDTRPLVPTYAAFRYNGSSWNREGRIGVSGREHARARERERTRRSVVIRLALQRSPQAYPIRERSYGQIQATLQQPSLVLCTQYQDTPRRIVAM